MRIKQVQTLWTKLPALRRYSIHFVSRPVMNSCLFGAITLSDRRLQLLGAF